VASHRSKPKFFCGQIIRAVVRDRHGYRKTRPVIILTPTDEIEWDSPMVVAAVTTSGLGHPLPANYLRLPAVGEPGGRITGLPKPSAAVVDWLETIYPDEILDVYGRIPERLLRELLARVGELDEDDQDDELAPS